MIQHQYLYNQILNTHTSQHALYNVFDDITKINNYVYSCIYIDEDMKSIIMIDLSIYFYNCWHGR